MVRPASSEKGSVLIGVLMVAIMLVAFFLVYANWSTIGSKSVVRSLGMQKATYNAESGYYAALDWLKTPAADTLTTAPFSLNSLTDGATYQLTLQRSDTDPSVINIISTGAFVATGGPTLDWLGRPAFTAVVEAKVRVEFIRDYFAAVPGLLQIANGSNLWDGKVYGKDLVFAPGTATTQVEAAYYFSSVAPLPTPAPNFRYGGGPLQLPSEMGVPRLSLMQAYYENLATDSGGACVLPVSAGQCRLSGGWSPPSNPFKVCICQGNLVLGSGGAPLQINGNTVIYVEGKTMIEGSIIAPNPPSDWLAVLSIRDVTIELPAPNILTINGTFVTDRGMTMQGGSRGMGAHLTFNGGVVAQKGISLAGYAGSRTYSYRAAPQDLKLPFLVQSLGWAIRKMYIPTHAEPSSP